MSCNYAEGLSPYEDKGVLGIAEKFEPIDKLKKKCGLLAQLIASSKHVVVHTGAGISTSAGIPDFRGPNGVWTLEKEGKKPSTDISFADAKPTKTHMALKKLVDSNKVQYVVSQNIDGLHLKSGLPRKCLAELHGNMFVDECNLCKRQFVRNRPVETVGKKNSGVPCAAGYAGGRPCRGRLYDAVLDWEHSLPDSDLNMAECHSSIADLSICLGTTLQIVPSGNLPLETAKYGGKLVICNLQPTKHDNKADLVINYYVDDILQQVMDMLGLEIPPYDSTDDPSKLAENAVIDWTISKRDVLTLEKMYRDKCKGVKKKRLSTKSRRKSDEDLNDVKVKVIKTEVDVNNEMNKAVVKTEVDLTPGETSKTDVNTEIKEEVDVSHEMTDHDINDVNGSDSIIDRNNSESSNVNEIVMNSNGVY